jgi:hypothetical protein
MADPEVEQTLRAYGAALAEPRLPDAWRVDLTQAQHLHQHPTTEHRQIQVRTYWVLQVRRHGAWHLTAGRS